MSGARVDHGASAAESRLDRIDDEPGDGHVEMSAGTLDLTEVAGLHVEDQAGPRDLDRDDDERHDDFAASVDAFDEAFNARDLDGLLELVRTDCETPGLAGGLDGFFEAIADLWDRRPGVLLTRAAVRRDADTDEHCLGVLWELSDLEAPSSGRADGARWWPIATVHFDDLRDGEIGVVEFCDDSALLDELAGDEPDMDLDEGSRWSEWSDGADGPY